MTNQVMKRKLLREIQEADFVLKELNLFLNTHPHHRAALEKFQKYEQISARLKAEYEKLYGPLTPSVNNNLDSWEWILGPWPWENY